MNHLAKVLLCCLTALWLSPSTAQAQSPASNVLYVNVSAGGIDDGTSWANAYTNLQDAITTAASGDEIWVAQGTYYPDEGVGITNDNSNATFQLKNGVALYGGFIGTETQLSEWDWENNPTILSGDINQNGDWAGNSYTVVTGSNTDNTAVLDGFIITKGTANGNPTTSSTGSSGRGGGMYNEAGSPRVANCVFSGNYAFWGGGMYNVNNSSPSMINIVFLSNLSIYGGGMYNNYYSSPIVTNSSFIENNGGSAGGGAYNNNYSSPVIKNSAFSGNTSFDGGGMYNNNHSSPSITNSSFIGNYFEDPESTGGGMCNINSSNPNITNSLFSGNSTGYFGGGLFNSNSNPILTNTIIWNNTVNGNTLSTWGSIYNSTNSSSTISYSLIANSGGSGSWDSNIGTDGGNNIDANPQFTDAANGDYSLQLTSPAVNTGDPNTDLNLFLGGASAALDLAGNPRLVSGIIDMGTFENQTPCPTGGIVFVNTNATGDNNGTSWTDAYTNLQDALDNNCSGVTEIWVAAGTYKPSKYPANCNGCNSSRDNTFQLKDGIALYGGFNGTETTLSERDFENNTTILSGDYNDDDTVSGSGNTLVIFNNNENAYHVVLAAFPVNDTTSTTRIDGFTITGGNANVGQTISVNGINYSKDNGGGIYTILGNNTILNNKIEACTAGSSGGGIFLNRGINTLTNNTILVNRADSGGGAYILFGSNTFSANTISNNTGSPNSGGGMNFRNSNSTLTNNIISMNLTPTFGGGINFEDGTYVISDNTIEDNSASIGGGLRFRIGNVSLTNNQINNNEANLGGGIFSGTTSGNDLTDNGTFIFTGNTISGNTSNNEGGGGWINRGNYTLTNNTISNNTAVQGGGGFFIRNSTTTSNENTIFGNSINSTTGIAGGGFVFINGTNSLSKNIIADNSATNVGGILFQGGINNLTGNRVSGNTAIDAAGGIFTFQGTNTLTNNSFYSNTASIGGGIYLEEGANALVNNSFTGNTANTNGGGMYFDNSSPTITNTIIWNNTADGSTTMATASVFGDNSTPTFSHSLIANSGGSGSWATAIGTDGGNNIDADPLFVAPGLNTSGDYRLQACSPAINAGSNAAVPSGVTTDLDGNPRFFNNGTVDMGAYEYQLTAAPVITSVSPGVLPCEGGTILTITGTNLCAASVVTIGGISASGLVQNSATEIAVTVPAGSGTAVPVQVTTPSGVSNSVSVDYGACCNITINSVATTSETCPGANDGTLTVTATCVSCFSGNADIRYSIDNSNFSNTTGVFTGLAPGPYTVYVRDVNDNSCTDSDGPHNIESNGNCVPDENCSPDPLVLNEAPISGGTYRSVSTIQSAGTVAASSEVLFTAGESITFLPGFTVQAGAIFAARIEDCIPPSTNDLVAGASAGKESGAGTGQRPDMWEIIGTDQLSIFPNPFRNQATIALQVSQGKQVAIRLFDLNGKLVYNVLEPSLQQSGEQYYALNSKGLTPGVYVLVVLAGEQQFKRRLVILR